MFKNKIKLEKKKKNCRLDSVDLDSNMQFKFRSFLILWAITNCVIFFMVLA